MAALRRAAPVAADRGVTLLLENLNTRVDHPGHFLDRTPEALDIIDEVGDASVRVLFDLYHAVVMDESPAEVLAAGSIASRTCRSRTCPGATSRAPAASTGPPSWAGW